MTRPPTAPPERQPRLSRTAIARHRPRCRTWPLPLSRTVQYASARPLHPTRPRSALPEWSPALVARRRRRAASLANRRVSRQAQSELQGQMIRAGQVRRGLVATARVKVTPVQQLEVARGASQRGHQHVPPPARMQLRGCRPQRARRPSAARHRLPTCRAGDPARPVRAVARGTGAGAP